MKRCTDDRAAHARPHGAAVFGRRRGRLASSPARPAPIPPNRDVRRANGRRKGANGSPACGAMDIGRRIGRPLLQQLNAEPPQHGFDFKPVDGESAKWALWTAALLLGEADLVSGELTDDAINTMRLSAEAQQALEFHPPRLRQPKPRLGNVRPYALGIASSRSGSPPSMKRRAPTLVAMAMRCKAGSRASG